MNERFVGLKSCLPSSTSRNDKARIRVGHFVTGFVLRAVGPILTHFPARPRNSERRKEGWRRGERGEETLLPCIFYNQAAASQREQKPQLQKQNTHN